MSAHACHDSSVSVNLLASLRIAEKAFEMNFKSVPKECFTNATVLRL